MIDEYNNKPKEAQKLLGPTKAVAREANVLLDAIKAAEAMDKIDRAEGGDRAGKYRDQASVYRAEINRRRK